LLLTTVVRAVTRDVCWSTGLPGRIVRQFGSCVYHEAAAAGNPFLGARLSPGHEMVKATQGFGKRFQSWGQDLARDRTWPLIQPRLRFVLQEQLFFPDVVEMCCGVVPQGFSDHMHRESRGIALAGEQSRKSAYPGDIGQAPGGSDAPGDQGPGGCHLVLWLNPSHGRGDDVIGDTEMAELRPKCARSQATARVPALYPGRSEGGIVHQAKLDEAIEDPVRRGPRDTAATQRLFELCPRLRRRGEQAQADRSRDSFRVSTFLVDVFLAIDLETTESPRGGTAPTPPPAGTPGGLGIGPRHGQKSMGAGSGSSASSFAPMPSFSLMRFSISSARSGLSLRKARAFSFPCPS
jgi:hypothetical protein